MSLEPVLDPLGIVPKMKTICHITTVNVKGHREPLKVSIAAISPFLCTFP